MTPWTLHLLRAVARELRQWVRLLGNNAVRLVLGLNRIAPEAQESQGGLGMLLKRLKESSEDHIEWQRRLDTGEITQQQYTAKWADDHPRPRSNPGAPLPTRT